MKKLLTILIALILLPAILTGQSKTNFQKLYQLINGSVNKVGGLMENKSSLTLIVASPSSLELLKPKVVEAFSKSGFSIKNENTADIAKLTYTITQVNVEYSEAEKDGFFGDMISERTVNLKGIVSFSASDGSVKALEIDESVKDSIKVDEIKSIEDATIAFTQGKKQEVSFFSNLMEPILVIGTLVTTIILLFTVRGK